jgi:hypothetical protein
MKSVCIECGVTIDSEVRQHTIDECLINKIHEFGDWDCDDIIEWVKKDEVDQTRSEGRVESIKNALASI